MSHRANILVTRPSGQGTALAAALEEMGYTAFEQPLLELHKLHSNTPDIEHYLKQLESYQHLIFISGNAVRFGMEKILEQWQELPGGSRVYAIGSKTAQLLSVYGLDVVAGVGMTSESLLAVESLREVRGEKVLIVKGVGGRNTLREGLSARGAAVDELACYRRSCPCLEPGELAGKISSWNINLVLLSSGEGFSNMLALLSPAETINLYNMPLVVPSMRVACMARDAGFTAVYEAKNATDDAMLEAVEHTAQHRRKISEREERQY